MVAVFCSRQLICPNLPHRTTALSCSPAVRAGALAEIALAARNFFRRGHAQRKGDGTWSGGFEWAHNRVSVAATLRVGGKGPGVRVGIRLK